MRPELLAVLLMVTLGLVLLSAGLCAWLGWPVALTVIGALLVVLGVSSGLITDSARREA